jgi:hypothetical protein
MNDYGAPWTPARVERLRELWPTHSAAEIARLLKGTTRRAVLGKVWRLGLKKRAEWLAMNQIRRGIVLRQHLRNSR